MIRSYQKLRNFSVVVLLSFLGSMVMGQNNLIISQYQDANGGTIKGIELLNVSGGSIDFSITGLDVKQGRNGNAAESFFTLSAGILADRDVMVIGTTEFDTYLRREGLITVLYALKAFTYNGNDALEIHLDGNLEDMFGITGSDPSTEWAGGGVSTANQNIQLLGGITTGDTDGWIDPSLRFETVSTDNSLTGFGLAPLIPCTAPTTQAVFNAPSIFSDNQIDLTWTVGNGDAGVVIIANEGSAVSTDPTSGVTYTGNASFSTGDLVGTGYVVYVGDATAISVTNLDPGTDYHFAIYEYNTINVCYLTTTGTTTETTTTSFDIDSDISDPTTQVITGSISSIANSEGAAVNVFTFKLADSGTSDGQSTSINTVVIEKGSGNTVADWSSVILGAKLNDGSDIMVTGATINSSNITFDLTGIEYIIADNTSKEVTLSIWLTTSVTDQKILEFEIPIAHGFKAEATSSTLLPILGAAVTSNQQSIEVVASEFEIAVAASVEINSDFALTATAVDVNGNTDLVARNIGLTLSVGAGTLSSTLVGTGPLAMSKGVYDWIDLQHDTEESIVIDATDGIALTTSSGAISILDPVNIQVFISEVADPLDEVGARFVEFYNAGVVSVTLDGFYLGRQINGGSFRNIALTGTIAAGSTFVIANNSTDFDSKYSTTANQYNTTISSNGNDGYFFYLGGDNVTGTLIDSYGVLDQDGTGFEWEFLDSRAVRNADVLSPNTTWTASEWVIDFPATVITTGFEPGVHFTCTPPTMQATAVTFGSTNETEMVVNWVKGNGTNALIVIKEGALVDAEPVSGVDYSTATSVFSDGVVDLGTSNIVTFSGVSSTQTVTVFGLTQGSTYHIAVYEYNASDFCYNTAMAAIGSNTTASPNDTDSEIVAPAVQIATGTVSSMANAIVDAIDVFTFKLTDAATSDAQPTTVSSILIAKGANDTVADWSSVVAGIVLNDGTSDLTITTTTLNTDNITVDLTGNEYVIANNTSAELTLSVYLKTFVTDGEILEFEIPATHGLVADAVGSLFSTTLAGAITSNLQTIDVVATIFNISAPTNVTPTSNFSVTATAVDANGNTDMAARNVTLSSNTGTGVLRSIAGLGPVEMTKGVYIWADVQYGVAEEIALDVTDGILTTTTSSINVVSTIPGVYFSEYFEGSSNNQYLEIYNDTGFAISLGNYEVKVSNNGVGFDNHASVPTAYRKSLSGTLMAGDVYIIYNGAATLAEMTTEGDLALSFGNNPGDRVAAFNGNDAIGLFENGTLVDLIGDPAFDPGTGWGVAGTVSATANHTLVRKSTVTEGNTTASGSFGTNEENSEWVVFAQDDVANIGFHVGCASPTTQATDVTFGSTNETEMVVNWVRGNGSNALIVIKEGALVDAEPVSGVDNTTASSVFSDGVVDLGNGNIAVFSGNSNTQTVTVTGLSAGTVYHVAVYEYNSIDNCYNITTPAIGNKTTASTSTLTVVASIVDFGAFDNGSASSSQSFTVQGTNLTTEIVVAAPANFEVSIDNNTYSSSVNIGLSLGTVVITTVYVRFTPTSGVNEAKAGDITISTTGTTNETIAVAGTEQGNVAPTGGVFITELADPNNNAGLRYIELYNSTDVAVDFTEGSGWRIDKYTNASATVSQTLALSGSIAAKGFYIIATGVVDADFATAYGVEPNQFDGADNNVAGSNGDDNLELYNGSNVLIDQFGVPGEDGTDTSHEFEDGRAERKSTIALGNPTWDVAEWNIDNDGTLFSGGGIKNAPADFDIAAWIGTGGPLLIVDISSYNGGFAAEDVGATSASTSFTVTGSDLEGVITVTAPEGFSVSDDDITFTSAVELPQASNNQLVYVKFSPTLAQAYSGNIAIESTNAPTQTIAVAGTGLSAESIYYEGFDSCPSSSMTVYSAASNKDWDCTTSGNTGNAALMAGFGADEPNNEWLITPAVDLSAATNAALTFYSWTQYKDTSYPLITVMASSDYIGSGDPKNATWISLAPIWPAEDSKVWTASGDLDLSSYIGGSVYIAYHFTSTGTSSGIEANWAIDDILIEDKATVANPSFIITQSLVDFGSVANGAVSASQSFTIEGANLAGDINITAPANFEVSLDDETFATSVVLSPESGILEAVAVYARFVPASGINSAIIGNITVNTTNATQQTIAVNGTEIGNDEITNDLFISEYIESSGNIKGLEIYNGTGESVDLSQYTLKQSYNGIGFGNDPVADVYDLPLTGTLADGDVFVVYNAEADGDALTSQGDLGLTYADIGEGVRVTAFNGNDAIGLFKNGVLIDLFGDPSNDPGIGWDVAGVATATVDHILVRKETITTGNIVPLGSFGSSESTSEWIVLDIDDFSSTGSHTTIIVEAGFTLNTIDFTRDFGSLGMGAVSDASSYLVSGNEIAGDFTITIPAGFEASLTSDFSNKVGHSTLPLSITPVSGVIDAAIVYIRFAPDAEASFSGNLVHSAAGYTSEELAVSGEGIADVTGIHDNLKSYIAVYPVPSSKILSIKLTHFNKADVQVMVKTITGKTVLVQTRSLTSNRQLPLELDIAALKNGVYILEVLPTQKVGNNALVYRTRFIKNE